MPLGLSFNTEDMLSYFKAFFPAQKTQTVKSSKKQKTQDFHSEILDMTLPLTNADYAFFEKKQEYLISDYEGLGDTIKQQPGIMIVSSHRRIIQKSGKSVAKVQTYGQKAKFEPSVIFSGFTFINPETKQAVFIQDETLLKFMKDKYTTSQRNNDGSGMDDMRKAKDSFRDNKEKAYKKLENATPRRIYDLSVYTAMAA